MHPRAETAASTANPANSAGFAIIKSMQHLANHRALIAARAAAAAAARAA
jgi:hypothetical protein